MDTRSCIAHGLRHTTSNKYKTEDVYKLVHSLLRLPLQWDRLGAGCGGLRGERNALQQQSGGRTRCIELSRGSWLGWNYKQVEHIASNIWGILLSPFTATTSRAPKLYRARNDLIADAEAEFQPVLTPDRTTCRFALTARPIETTSSASNWADCAACDGKEGEYVT
eukprot:6205057-Pleurochrysis_carterae.AAC.1